MAKRKFIIKRKEKLLKHVPTLSKHFSKVHLFVESCFFLLKWPELKSFSKEEIRSQGMGVSSPELIKY